MSSETTGSHQVPDTKGGVLDAIRRDIWRQGLAIVLSGVGMLGATGAAFYVDAQSRAARDEQIHERLREDLDALDRDRRTDADALDDLRGDVRALKAAYETGQADTIRRLERIDEAIGGRRR